MAQKLNALLKNTISSFEMMVSNSPTPSFLINSEGTVLCHNFAAEDLFKDYPKNLKGLEVQEIFKANPSMNWNNITNKFSNPQSSADGLHSQFQLLVSIGAGLYWSKIEISRLGGLDSENPFYIMQIRNCEKEKACEQILSDIALKSIPGYWIRNLKKQTQYTSPGLLKSLGYTPQDFPNWSGDWHQFVYSEDLLELHNILDTALLSSREASIEKELRLVHKNKSTIWHNAIIKTVDITSEGHASRIFGWFENLTYQKTLENKYLRAKNDAVQANTAKSLFLANMSHEIRTPLNAIIGYTDLLVEEDLSGDVALFTNQIQTAGDHLKKIVDEILDYSKLEASYYKEDEVVFHLKDMIKDIVETYKKETHSKGLSLRWSVSPTLPDYIKTNKKILIETIQYVLNNAVKFTHNGGISFSVKGNTYSNGEVDLRFRVEDSGVGISKAMWEKVFEPFMQADTSSSRVFGGTGLGLTIAKKNINHFNGNIEVIESSDAGTKICFNFIAQQADALATEDLRIDGDLKNHQIGLPQDKNLLRILIAEDNLLNLQVLQQTLLALGYSNVSCVDNGVDVLKFLDSSDYDLLLMDVHMPQKDGYTTTHEILSKHETNRPYIVGLSASAMPYEVQKGLDSGMDSYLTKPFRMDELLNVIERLNKQSSRK